jgi:ribonuclease J
MNFSKNDLVFIPLGGSGEIGMNCNLYHYNDSWIMIDLGVMFGNSNLSSNELIMPNIDFLIKNNIKLDGLILTHAHEDHIGAVPFLYEKLGSFKIFTTSFTASVLKRKFDSIGIKEISIDLLNYNENKKIGKFSIETLALTHSIPEPNAIIIRTEKLNIFHTGDWKIDPTPLVGNPIDQKKLNYLKNEGMAVMVCDSTNVFNENPSGSENDVREELRQIFSKKIKNKIIITCFASNIARLETILKVSNEFNKCCVFLGRSIHRIYESAKENNYLKNLNNIVSEKESGSISEDNLVIVCTGSQGETNAALSRLVNDKNRFIEIFNDDLVIFSSREIPGNEKKISELKNQLLKKKVRIIDSKISKIHVSGHPSKKELEQMYEWISPNTIIPVHGEFKHLSEHANFAKKCGIKKQVLVENGDVVLLENNNSRIIEKVFSGRILLKGNKTFSLENNFLKNLKIVSSEGEIFVNIICDLDNKLLTEPVVFCPTVTDKNELVDDLKILISEQLFKMSSNSLTDQILSEELKKIVRSYIKKSIGLKPLTYIEIVRI